MRVIRFGKIRVGTSDQRSRTKLLALLAAFVAAFGVASRLVTSRIALHDAPLTRGHPATYTPAPTPTPLVCSSTELALTGVIDECATKIPEQKLACSAAGGTLDVLLRLAADNQTLLLYIELKGTYIVPGTYDLPPWRWARYE